MPLAWERCGVFHSPACLYLDNVFYEHKPWFPHPESPERLRRLVEGLRKTGILGKVEVIGAPRKRMRKELALMVHSESYVETIRKASAKGGVLLDPDTYVSGKTYEAALAVLASIEDAVRKIEENRCTIAIIAGRPPGHHAGYNGAAMGAPTLGFCIFNASALASKLLAARGRRVLHVDFDLHHGNGVQEILYQEPRVVHIDLHQDPATIYPGTGWPWQTGSGEAKGTKINIILPPGSGDDIFYDAVEKIPELVSRIGFKPSIIVLSAGFDAYRGDGLGGLRLTTNSYYHLARVIMETYNLPVIIVWEGGYSTGLTRGAPSFIAGIMGIENPYSEEKTTSRPTVQNLYHRYLEELEKALF